MIKVNSYLKVTEAHSKATSFMMDLGNLGRNLIHVNQDFFYIHLMKLALFEWVINFIYVCFMYAHIWVYLVSGLSNSSSRFLITGRHYQEMAKTKQP